MIKCDKGNVSICGSLEDVGTELTFLVTTTIKVLAKEGDISFAEALTTLAIMTFETFVEEDGASFTEVLNEFKGKLDYGAQVLGYTKTKNN